MYPLTSAHTFPCRDYLEGLEPHSSDQLGNETLYLFGPNSELGFALGPLIEHYRPPTFAESDLAYAFGIGTNATGIYGPHIWEKELPYRELLLVCFAI